jgi:hypothetical protein
VNCYTTGHRNNATVVAAFAEGGPFPVVPVSAGLQPGPMFTFGTLRGTMPLLQEAMADGREWFYCDHGYFKSGHFAGYYRVTRNAWQHDGRGLAEPGRWASLGLRIKPWQRGGRSVLVCPPGEVYAALHGFTSVGWLEETTAQLKAATDRPVIVRTKPGKQNHPGPLEHALRDCHAIVVHSSNAAVDALLAGVPVFCTAPCAAQTMGHTDPALIETPLYPDDRERWARVLAANQWTLDEMRDGACWHDLNCES